MTNGGDTEMERREVHKAEAQRIRAENATERGSEEGREEERCISITWRKCSRRTSRNRACPVRRPPAVACVTANGQRQQTDTQRDTDGRHALIAKLPATHEDVRAVLVIQEV